MHCLRWRNARLTGLKIGILHRDHSISTDGDRRASHDTRSFTLCKGEGRLRSSRDVGDHVQNRQGAAWRSEVRCPKGKSIHGGVVKWGEIRCRGDILGKHAIGTLDKMERLWCNCLQVR